MVSIRIPVLIIFIVSLIFAAYLGFSLIHLLHDKVIHFITFMVLTIEFYFIFNTKRKELKILRYSTLLICTGGAGIGLEILQSVANPTRVFDVNDIFCNIGGSLVGVGVSSGYLMWIMKNKRPQKQSYRMDVRQLPNRIEHEDVVPEEEDYVKIEMKDAAEQV